MPTTDAVGLLRPLGRWWYEELHRSTYLFTKWLFHFGGLPPRGVRSPLGMSHRLIKILVSPVWSDQIGLGN